MNPAGVTPIDGELDPVEPYRAAEDRAIRAELPLPEIVAEHHDRVASGHLVFVGSKGAAQLGLHAHHREEVAAHQQADRQFRQRAGLGGEPHNRLGERDQSFEAPAAIPDVDVVAIRREQDRPDGAEEIDPTVSTSPAARHGERPEQQRIGEAEDRRVRADANRERDDGDEP